MTNLSRFIMFVTIQSMRHRATWIACSIFVTSPAFVCASATSALREWYADSCRALYNLRYTLATYFGSAVRTWSRQGYQRVVERNGWRLLKTSKDSN